MCLLTVSSASAIRNALLNTPGLMEDIFQKNADGLGIMYGTSKGLKIIKKLPKTVAECTALIQKLPNDDRTVAIHWRWRTHGDINLAMVHPVMVSETSAMMHNGILHTGNKVDTTKSDTWHFVQDFMSGVTDDVLHSPAYLNLLGGFIEDNRFAVATQDGRISMVNPDQWTHMAEVFFSNEYAWSPEILDPSLGLGKYSYKGWSSLYDDKEEEDLSRFPEEILDIVDTSDSSAVTALLTADPKGMANTLADALEIRHVYETSGLSQAHEKCLEALLSRKPGQILSAIQSHTAAMSDVLCLYTAWDWAVTA